MRAAGIRRRARPVEGDTPMTNVRAIVCAGLALVSATLYGQQAGPGRQGAPPPPAPVIDLSGYWTPVMHEDAYERGAGNEIADYGGFALNEAGRLWALSVRPLARDAAPPPVRGLRHPVPDALDRQLPHLGGPRFAHAAPDQPSTSTARRQKASARSGWTAARIRRPGRRTRPEASRPVGSWATRSSCRPRTSSRGGCGATACPAAIKRP